MARLVIKLLGCFQVTLDGQPLTGILSDKGRALLAYLALEADRPHRREALAEMLWPNQPTADGRANLRQSMHRLRQYIDDRGTSAPTLLITPQEVQFNCKSDCWLDIAEFRCRMNSCQNHHPTGIWMCDECRGSLQTALGLYKGDLLAGFTLPDCPHFDWWLLARVEEYHRQVEFVLDWLIDHFEQQGDYLCASQYAQRAIELEPWSEYSHRQKMRLLALGGNRSAAIYQYKTCRKILAAEMGIEPSTKTKNLLEQILRGNLPNQEVMEEDQRFTQPQTAPGYYP